MKNVWRTEEVGDIVVQVWRHHEPGRGPFPWCVTFSREPKSLERPGKTQYSPGDNDLPDDYPRTNEPDALLEWARRHAQAASAH